MEQLIATYQQAHLMLILAERKLEELRDASVPYLTTRIETAWDDDSNATNWHDVHNKDKSVIKKFKKFQTQVEVVSSLAQKANTAQRKMIEEIKNDA